jgi:hypothetical protein
MRKLLEVPERYEVLLEEPDYGGYPVSLYDEERYPELLGERPPRRRIDSRELERILEDTERRRLPEPEQARELPQPKQVARTAPTESMVKLKSGERIVKRWAKPVWFIRMSDVKNVIGQDVHLTRLRSGVYAFRGVDDETFENLYRIVGKRIPSESDTFGPLKIRSRGKKRGGFRHERNNGDGAV